MRKAVLPTGPVIARQNLLQLEEWRPPDDWGRKRQAENIRQVQAWLAQHDPRLVS